MPVERVRSHTLFVAVSPSRTVGGRRCQRIAPVGSIIGRAMDLRGGSALKGPTACAHSHLLDGVFGAVPSLLLGITSCVLAAIRG